MSLKKIGLVFFLLLLLQVLHSPLYAQDTSIYINSARTYNDVWVKPLYTGVPIVATGVLISSQNKNFRTLRNDFIPHYKCGIDGYIQYAPAATLLIMKTLGVESRNKWGKMLVADAFSMSLSLVVSHSLKILLDVERPDGSTNNSFPSGHTLTAFMCATMLDKEYGHVSWLIPAAGYATATATGIMRIANNRHWIGDVLAGAGMGIVLTEYGYLFADLLIKEKNKNNASAHSYDYSDNSNSVGLYAGWNKPLIDFCFQNNRYETRAGSRFGLEGSWFISTPPSLGFGINLGIANYTLFNKGTAEQVQCPYYNAMIGAYYTQNIFQCVAFNAKILGGYVHYVGSNETSLGCISNAGVSGLAGASFAIRKEHVDFRLGVEYALLPLPIKKAQCMQTISIIGATNIRF